MDDAAVVARQLGRSPRGRWRCVARCSHGFPTCIATEPLLDTGEPFPTLYYLTCPHLVARTSALESQGESQRWREAVAADPSLASRLRNADVSYRGARAAEGGGVDPTPGVGIAGQRDPLAVKCLHAHVAGYLAGIDDPIGAAVVRQVSAECADRRCEEAV
ncbi:MAG: DUF501 domain-containing protein [Coriobacteriia bacterium]